MIIDRKCHVEAPECLYASGDRECRAPCLGPSPIPAPDREWAEEEVERIARLMAAVRNGKPCWAALVEAQRDSWLVMARAVLVMMGRGK